jgi:hypothetical protein
MPMPLTTNHALLEANEQKPKKNKYTQRLAKPRRRKFTRVAQRHSPASALRVLLAIAFGCCNAWLLGATFNTYRYFLSF